MTGDSDLVLQQEQLSTATTTESAGSVRATKRVTHATETLDVARGSEHADVQHEATTEDDDGEVHVLPDGSVSVPVFEERLVVTKQLVVRERVVLRKHTVYEDHVVTADLRTEHLDVDVDPDIAHRVRTAQGGEQ